MQTYPDITFIGCGTTLGAVSEAQCAVALSSEIESILISDIDDTNAALPKNFPADPTLATSWTTAINNTVAAGIKSFPFVGSMPVAPENVVRRGTKVHQLPRRRQIVGVIPDTSQANKDFARSIQKGVEVFVWFITKGGVLYGATNQADAMQADYHPYGIKANVINWHIDLPEGDNSVESINVVLEWDNIQDPPSFTSPVTL